jgi:hypothetical protein
MAYDQKFPAKSENRLVLIRTESDLRICHTSEVYRVFWYPCLSCNLDRTTLHADLIDAS